MKRNLVVEVKGPKGWTVIGGQRLNIRQAVLLAQDALHAGVEGSAISDPVPVRIRPIVAGEEELREADTPPGTWDVQRALKPALYGEPTPHPVDAALEECERVLEFPGDGLRPVLLWAWERWA